MNDARSVVLGPHPASSWVIRPHEIDLSRPDRPSRHPIRIAAQPQPVVIDLARTAVVVVDMQNDFCHPSGYLGSHGVDCGAAQRLVTPINRLLRSLRASHVPVVWVRWAIRADRLNLGPGMPQVHGAQAEEWGRVNPVFAQAKGGWGAMDGTWGAELVDTLEVASSDLHIRKCRFSGFFGTQLDGILRSTDVQTLLFAGVATDICVMATLQDAMFLGYDALLLTDCAASSMPQFCVEAAHHHVEHLYGFLTTSLHVHAGLRAGIAD